MKTQKLLSIFVFFTAFWLLLGMASKKPKSSPNISIMTYNVENLFDVADDPDKDDAAFLPLALKQSQAHKDNCNQIQVKKWRDECLYLDWSQEKLDQKIANLVRNILQVNHGQGPDILVVQEIENIHVVDMLAKALDQGYKYTALIEGRDVRGIDIGVISKIPLQDEAKIHYVDFKGISVKEKQDTRGIFEASFALPKTSKNKTETLVVYGVHFPAPYHKKEFRIQSFAKLNQLLQSHGKDVLAVAVGDFNVTSDEDQKDKIVTTYAGPYWKTSHKIKELNTQGTYYYPPKKDWSFLDMMHFSHNLTDDKGWEVNIDSIIVANQGPDQIDSKGYPNSFNINTGKGASDHLPIYAELMYQ